MVLIHPDPTIRERNKNSTSICPARKYRYIVKCGQIGNEDEEGFERMGEAQEDQLGAGFGGGPVGGGKRGGRRLGGVLGALVLVVVAVLLLAAGVTEDPSTATGALVLVVVVLLVVAGEVVVREVSEENGDKT